MLRLGDEFSSHGDRVFCVDETQASSFERFLQSLNHEPEAWIFRRKNADHLLVRAESIRPAGEIAAAAIMFYSTAADRYLWADIGELYKLTKSELTVVKSLVAGQPVDFIAKRQGISVETVRTHVRRIYGKVGVGNREQLFSTASRFRIS